MKKIFRMLLAAAGCALLLPLSARSFAPTSNGAVVQPAGGDAWTTEVAFYAPSIVRVTKYPQGSAPEKGSYSVILQPEAVALHRTPIPGGGVEIASAAMTVRIDAAGAVQFVAPAGEALLAETASGHAPCENRVDAGRYRVEQRFVLEPDECIYGLGQRQSPSLNQRGQDVRIWTGNTNITIPYITSEKGYGLYWDNAGDSRFSDTPEQMRFASEVAPCIDYYFLYDGGTQDGVIAAIRQLTGRATMFPLWAHGYWQCRERYKSSDELCDVLDEHRRRGIPLDGIVQDWQYWGCDSNWNAMRFMNPHYIDRMGDPEWMRYLPNNESPDARYPAPRIKSPEAMVQYVHDHNAHLMISIWASFGPWTEQYAELDAIGALLPFDTWPRNRGVKPYDPFHPAARDIYWKHLRNLYDMGMDAWWTDSTEPDHWEREGDLDYPTHDGSWRSVKNAFALMTNGGIYDHQRATPGNTKRSLQMTRCGTFGIQRYGTFSWSGDVGSNWKTLKNQIPSGLNYILCGIPYWNTDIGGFFGGDYRNDPHNPAMQELQVRWMQWGCFMPLMRNHCSSPMVNEIYRFGDEGDWAYDVQKQFIELRYRLMPYIYSMAGAVVQEAGSMMRPLVMDFAADKRAIRLDDQYMFGPAFLVKPVTDPLYTWRDEARNGHLIFPDITQASAPVEVYLPEGAAWYDFWTGERFEGGRSVLRPTPIDEMPLYVRAGSIVPFGPAVQYTSEKPWDDLEVRVYAGADGQFTLYEDEGDTYNYEQGAFTQIRFRWSDADRTLTIEPRTGSFDGMLPERTFRIGVVGAEDARSEAVRYTGAAVTLRL